MLEKKYKSINEVKNNIITPKINQELEKNFMVITFEAEVFLESRLKGETEFTKVEYQDFRENQAYSLRVKSEDGKTVHYFAEYIGMGIFSVINRYAYVKVGRYIIVSPYTLEELKTLPKLNVSKYTEVNTKTMFKTVPEKIFNDVESFYNYLKENKIVELYIADKEETKIVSKFKYLSRVSTDYILVVFENEKFLIRNTCPKNFNISI